MRAKPISVSRFSNKYTKLGDGLYIIQRNGFVQGVAFWFSETSMLPAHVVSLLQRNPWAGLKLLFELMEKRDRETA